MFNATPSLFLKINLSPCDSSEALAVAQDAERTEALWQAVAQNR